MNPPVSDAERAALRATGKVLPAELTGLPVPGGMVPVPVDDCLVSLVKVPVAPWAAAGEEGEWWFFPTEDAAIEFAAKLARQGGGAG